VPSAIDPSEIPLPGSTEGPIGGATTRSVDLLTSWAQKLSPTVGIPIVALKAYGYAQLWSQQTQPACHLSWTTLAGIGKVESDHGQEGGTILEAAGRALPPILGPVLDGTGGTTKIPDHDHGQYDENTTYDRAVGPMQFVPVTWEAYQIDADQDGVADPNDINDAALAAADYLCAGGRNLSVPADWWAGILHYNNLPSYADNVFAAANQYGVLSHTAT
jgi:membrane-bound lytic murein transglycosylase B